MGQLVLSTESVTYSYPGSEVPAVDGVTMSVANGELLSVVGPNGSGKTTLLRLLTGISHPDHGTVTLVDRNIVEWNRAQLARQIGVVAQREEPAFPTTVEQSVLLGRYPHVGSWSPIAEKDRRVVNEALEKCDITHLRKRWTSSLSGGEWQRVRIARALAQEPRVLILDEPTSNLDIRHEMELLELVAELVGEGLCAVLVTHHVNLAARFSDRILVMACGNAVSCGTPKEVLTADTLMQVFGWPVDVVEWHGFPQFVPLRSRDQQDG